MRFLIPKRSKYNKVYRENWESTKIKDMVETNLKIQNIFKDLDSCTSPLEIAFKAVVDTLSLSVKAKFEVNRIKVLFIYFCSKSR
ncbi:MAG: hypothetical protein K2L64_01025 [Ureaplasma sp.]|nr:hypothetical protein [Ureaplasma sp.]